MIAALLKWVDARPDIDPLTGAVHTDPRTSGMSDADHAALEWALRAGAAFDQPVIAISAGPPGAEAILRDAIACGASEALRVALDPALPSDRVAAALASELGGVSLAVCGIWSTDRGSGSVPAFLAARLDAAQALGLVTLSFEPLEIRAERRLDRGRREILSVGLPAVISVEAASARLRRAPLHAIVSAGRAAIRVVQGPPGAAPPPTRTIPFRPRPRVLDAPMSPSARERVLALTGALSDRTPPQRVTLDPPAAADRIIEQLRVWGYLT